MMRSFYDQSAPANDARSAKTDSAQVARKSIERVGNALDRVFSSVKQKAH